MNLGGHPELLYDHWGFIYKLGVIIRGYTIGAEYLGI
jgi:hypothetical protein